MDEKTVWSILGISPTDDVEVIREAYREKLVTTNPEDDQEGFMALKESYDEAMHLAESTDEEELSEVMIKVDAIYRDITKRMDIECWNKLLSSPEFESIDEQEIIRNDFLKYTMENYKYSKEVWQKIDSIMSITQDADALKEDFPEDYIDFVKEAVQYGNFIMTESVIPGRENGIAEINDYAIETDQEPLERREFKYEVDEYIDCLEKIVGEFGRIDNKNISEEDRNLIIDRLGADIIQIREYDFYHVLEEIALIKYLYYKEKYDECFNLIEAAVDRTVMKGEKHSDIYYSHLVFMYLRFFMEGIHREKGLTISPERLAKCREVLPKSMERKYVNETHSALSLCSYLEGEKKTAADYMSYMSNYHRNSSVYSSLSKQIDSDRAEELPGMIEADPENISLKLSLAWIYTRQDRLDDAFDLVKDVIPTEDVREDYLFFIGRYYMDKGEFGKAVNYLVEWNEVLCEKYDPDAEYDLDDYTIKEVRSINRIPFSYYMISIAYFDQGDMDKAKEYILKAIKYADELDYYDYTGLYDAILTQKGEFEEGVDFWSNEIEKNNDYIVICHGNRQYMAYKADRVREVIEDYFYLRYYDPQFADSYVRAEEVYLDYNDMEGFETCLEYIKENEVSDIRLDFNYARYLRAKKEQEKSLEVYKSIEDTIDEDPTVLETPSSFYVGYGYCLMDIDWKNKEFFDKEELKEKLLSLIDKGRSCDDGNINVDWLEVDYRERYDKDFDLKPLYNDMLERFPDNGAIDYELGRLYQKDGEDEKAGGYFETGIKKSPRHINLHYELSDYYNDYRYRKLEENEYNAKAIEVAEELIELSYDERSAVQYALILLDGLEYDKALEFLNKAVEDFPEDAYVINARGLTFKRLEKYDEAEADFRRAIEVYKGKGRFVSYTNLVDVYEKLNKFDDAVNEYLNYMEKFDQHEYGNYNRLADIYNRGGRFEEAIEARKKAIAITTKGITGKECDLDFEFSINRIAEKYPDIPVEKFIDLIDYMYDIASSYSIGDRVDKMDEIEAENTAYVERINILKDLSGMPEEVRDQYVNAVWSVGHYYTFTRRKPEIAARYFERYVEIKEKKKSEIRYYDSLCQAYDLLGRVYMFIGDSSKAAEAGRKAIECIIKTHGSVDNYINYKRYRPLYLSRLSGIYLAMGEREKAFECLDMIDGSKKCTHCQYAFCVDKSDRLALYAELDGEYKKAIELYEYGKEHSGYETEKISGIRECRSKL